MLNDIFLNLAANSHFPTIAIKDLESFATSVGLFLNSEDFSIEKLQSIFEEITVNPDESEKDECEEEEEPVPKTLNRSQFWDVLVSIAKAKYVDQGHTHSLQIGFE